MKITINTNTGEIVVRKDTIKVTKSDWKSVPIPLANADHTACVSVRSAAKIRRTYLTTRVFTK